MRIRGSNAGRQPGQSVWVDTGLELAAMQDLGPRTRYAITNAPLRVQAVSIVDQIIEENNKREKANEQRAAAGQPLIPYLDPKDPALDAALARGVVGHQIQLLNSERSIEDSLAGIKPLVGKMSPRTARENAKTERLARRFRRW